ncbi:hypothetical protein, partial [Bacillus sp. SG-1]|uniref:hypothetical protein n=1 Tax=Bacillus sp. SG-1 TaxID=161544 RepID=UPI00015447F5
SYLDISKAFDSSTVNFDNYTNTLEAVLQPRPLFSENKRLNIVTHLPKISYLFFTKKANGE